MLRGELRTDNPQFAAEVLNSLLLSLDRTRGLLTGDVRVNNAPMSGSVFWISSFEV